MGFISQFAGRKRTLKLFLFIFSRLERVLKTIRRLYFPEAHRPVSRLSDRQMDESASVFFVDGRSHGTLNRSAPAQ